jgi:hypothetical protein
VLTVVDVPSQKAPSGSKGHRVLLTKAAAEAALPSLLGMALDYAPAFDRHDVRRKVGVITSAEIVGRNLEVGGYLYAKDFPEIVAEIGKSGVGRQAAGGRPQAPDLRPRTSDVSASQSGLLTEGARLRASLAAAVERIRSFIASRQESLRIEEPSSTVAAEAETVMPLGMSYEVANVMLENKRARVWVLTNVTFTGAAILRRDKAAYQETWIGLEG